MFVGGLVQFVKCLLAGLVSRSRDQPVLVTTHSRLKCLGSDLSQLRSLALFLTMRISYRRGEGMVTSYHIIGLLQSVVVVGEWADPVDVVTQLTL